MYLRSITAVRLPWEANVQARYLPASPLPSTTTSYSSAMDSVTFRKDRHGPRGGRERTALRHSAASAIIEGGHCISGPSDDSPFKGYTLSLRGGLGETSEARSRRPRVDMCATPPSTNSWMPVTKLESRGEAMP